MDPGGPSELTRPGTTVDELAEGDVAAVAALFRARTGRALDVSLVRSWSAGSPSVVAREGGALIGFALGRSFAPDVVELANVLVAEPRRRRGVGRALVRELERRAVLAGGRGAIVVTSRRSSPEGTHAAGFYERLGYRTMLDTGDTVVLGRCLP